jgi:hypothetical protein
MNVATPPIFCQQKFEKILYNLIVANQNSSLFVPLALPDLSDPTLTKINNEFQRICAAILSLQGSSTSTSSGWQSYTPAPGVTGSGMTITSPIAYWAKTLNNGNQVIVNLDISVSISGSGPYLMISLPSTVPASNTYGNVFSCILYSSSTPVAGMARLGTVGSTAGIYVYRADGSNFSAGSLEVVLSGWYEI